MRVALCGGTFDPMHRGHIEPLLEASRSMGWDRIVFIPAAQQPFKVGRTRTSAWDRWAMAALATSGDERLRLSAIELERGEISYTVDTLEALREAQPGAVFDWVIGDDNLELLPKWRALDRIFEIANFALLRREGGAVPTALQGRLAEPASRPGHGRIIAVDNARVNVSSTEIRRRVASGEPIGGMVAPAVEAYIGKYRLYREE